MVSIIAPLGSSFEPYFDKEIVLYPLNPFFIVLNFSITCAGPFPWTFLGPCSSAAFLTSASSTIMKTLCFCNLISINNLSNESEAHLLISNGKLSLRLLVLLAKVLQLLNRRIVREDMSTELRIVLGVLVSRVHLCVIGKTRQDHVQRMVHLLTITLEESSTATNEESISGENSLVVTILDIVAD